MKKLPLVPIQTLLDKVFPEKEDLIQDIFPLYGRAIISAPAKLGKSLFATGLSLGLAAGQDVMNFKIPKPRRVLYFDAEVGERGMQERLRSMTSALKCTPTALHENLFFCCDRTVSLTDTAGLLSIQDAIENTKPDLIVLDPLYKLQRGDENSSRDMSDFFKICDNLNSRYNCAICIIHHHGKSKDSTQSTPAHLNRGSSTIADWPDTLMTFQNKSKNPDTNAHRAKLSFTLRNDREPEPFLYERNEDNLWWEYQDMSKIGRPKNELNVMDILNYINNHPKQCVHAIEIAADMFHKHKSSESLTARVRKEALEQGLIVKDRQAYWTLTPKAVTLLNEGPAENENA